MANTKISALPASTTPLAGTEVLPIVQSSTTKQVSVANLTAGRAVSASSLSLTTPLTVANGGSGTGTAFTAGSVVFAGASGVYSQNNSKLFWDNTNNRLGIGTASPSYPLQVNGDSYLRGLAYFGVGAGCYIDGSTSTAGYKLYVWDNASSYVQRITVSSTGDTTLNTGNLIQGTAAKGVNFTANTPAAGMTSQLLNWYEEGTFTPSLVPGTSGSITLTVAAAKYTRIGRAVTVTGICEVSSVSSPVGTLLLQGLPYTNSSAASSRSAAAIYATGLAVTATTSIVGRIIPSESQIRIEKFAAGSTSAMAGDVQANTLIQFNLTYFV